MSRLPGGIGGFLSGTVGRREDKTYRVRLVVQAVFALTCVLLGVQFTRFVRAAGEGITPLPVRPPGVEGFLPISGLMGALDWVYQGALNPVHPAATILVLIAIVMALLLRKSFCSWVCPIGFLSDLLARFGRWSFGRNFKPWRWLDVGLRSLKYILMAFFVGSILTMSANALADFIASPYNRVADIKMGLFFTDLGRVGTIVMGSLVLGSIFMKGFWCRYLCPYGALLGFFSWASPARIRRTPSACLDCGLCDKACPARLPVSASLQITSQECTACLDCVAVCPRSDALALHLARRPVRPELMAAAVVGLFLVGYTGARVAGLWHNSIPDIEYVERIPELDGPEYGHPGIDGPAERAEADLVGER